MAELVLSTLGRAVGARLPGAFGQIGAALGRAGGALLGGSIDQALFGVTTRREGARLSDIHIQASSEGASIPAVFGRVRIAGQVIWAARFKEHVETTSSGGGKGGGPRVRTTNFRYTLSFAVGLCEGPVARIGRVWANGESLDLSEFAWRLHTGGEDQTPDPLIEAIEGEDVAPGYRGLAYIVFEDMPLERFGNAIPQLSFEIVRPAPIEGPPPLEALVKGICLMPGAGEFVYATEPVLRQLGPGRQLPENVHIEQGRANLLVSLDQLAADLPACESVLLVVAWFGDDLRCGVCEIHPCVDNADKVTSPLTWRVNGVTRAGARVISAHNGGPAYGGTPDDISVLQAIAELKARGYSVGLYPFLMMDVPAENALPDPYGDTQQAAYPWRGRITLDPAPGEPGSPDQTTAAEDQIADFFGAAMPAHFSETQGAPTYSGPSEWSYRRFILHHAKLAQIAGGVDAFVIGSELRGLTTARDGPASFPAVSALRTLAGDVRAMLGGETTITYAADWSEYFGHQLQDGSGDVLFHLDPLWADPSIDVVGIDWYPPLTDWREGAAHLDAEGVTSQHDADYLSNCIENGEAHAWYYASDEDRAAQMRTSITDGEGEPWVFRAKDVRNFWARPHYDRPGGVRSATPTAWTPQSKPIWFVELGCPAVDKGANAPNLFVDPKSSESALPHFSSGARDDLIQRRTIEAYLRYWNGSANPRSTLDDRAMIGATFAWCWDARPYPAFPSRVDVWSDGPVWRSGHWLNGRAGLSELGEVIRALCARAGVTDVDVFGLRGAVNGFVADSPASTRDALAPLLAAYDCSVAEREGKLVIFHREGVAVTHLSANDIAGAEGPQLIGQRADSAEQPIEARVRFLDSERDYLVGSVSARRLDRADGGVATIDAPMVLDVEHAEKLAQALLADRKLGAETLALDVSAAHLALECGDCITFEGRDGVFELTRVEDGAVRSLALRRTRSVFPPNVQGAPPVTPPMPAIASTPAFAVLDLPPLPGSEADERPLAAVFAEPWFGAHEVYAGPTLSTRARVEHAAVLGELLWALWPGPIDRWDQGNRMRVKLYSGALSSVTRAEVLNGANTFAIESEGEWEILQARSCVLTAPGEYELSDFLRARLGSAHAMRAPHPVGTRIVKIDDKLARVSVGAHEWEEVINFAAPPWGRLATDTRAASLSVLLPHAAGRPWPPAHLRARRVEGGDVEITWVRCARVGGDSWGGAEPPLGPEGEAYRVDILDGATALRTSVATAPAWTYPADAQVFDFGELPGSLRVRAAQIGEGGAAGLKTELTITL